MVLAGLRPEVVLDMAARSLSFWSYQMAQDKNYHLLMAKHWRERCDELESSHQTLMTKIKNDREVENKKIESNIFIGNNQGRAREHSEPL